MTKYGPLVTIWFDFPQLVGPKQGEPTVKMLHELQPDILMNCRAYHGGGAHQSTVGDYNTPEQKVGGFDMNRPWETCMMVSAHKHWSWHGSKDGVKSVKTCLGMMIRCFGGDGNVLLDVGPRPDGVIDPAQANLVKGIGAWMAKYGESVYGTRGGPYTPGIHVTSTRKGNTVYLHILDWPATGDLRLPALPAKINSATLLTGGKVQVTPEGSGLVIKVEPEHRQVIDTLVKLELDKPALDLAPIQLAASEAPAKKEPAKK